MISAPSSSRASLRKPFTAACGPTGKKKGVSMEPWGVVRGAGGADDESGLANSKKKFTYRVYQRKIHAIMLKSRTKEKVVPNEIPSAFPIGAFFGSAAEKPTAIRMMAQIAKISRLPKRMSCQAGALSPRNAAGFDARKFCGSMLWGSFRKDTCLTSSSRSNLGVCTHTKMTYTGREIV